MSRRKSSKDRLPPKPPRPPVVLVFGEGTAAHGSNDAKALARLLEFVNPGLVPQYAIKAMRRPVSLTRSAKPGSVRNWLSDVENVARGELAEVIAIVIHRDADGPDPGGKQYAALAKDLSRHLGGFTTVPAVPVQMTEAWWFLFPEAVRAVAPGAWRDLKIPSGSVETIQDPKKRLIGLTSKTSRTYRESDSEEIAKRILDQRRMPVSNSLSWDRFVADAQQIGQGRV